MKIRDMDEEEETDLPEDLEDRTVDYSTFKYIEKQLGPIYKAVEAGYADKRQQANDIEDGWNCYDCVLDQNQTFNGNSQVYVPIIHDAMTARQTRFINMLFPKTGRHTEIVGADGKVPYDMIALMDHYMNKAKMRRDVVPAMIRNGDVSGNYGLYVEWGEKSRYVTNKTLKPNMETELGPVEGSGEYEDIEYKKEKETKAIFSPIDTRDIVILPVTNVDDIQTDAESVTLILRYTKSKIKQCIKEKIFTKEAGETLLRNMSSANPGRYENTGKKAAHVAGVETDSKGNKTALIFQTWARLKVKGETRLMVTHFGGPDLILGCKRNPYWNDKIPVIWQPVEKKSGSVYGPSQLSKGVRKMQYAANDAVNMGFDSAAYALLPIIMTDPAKNPQVGSMILSMAAIWMTDPNSTKFAEFPSLWKDAFMLVSSCKEQIFQSLGVNPAMIPHGNTGKKPTQAQIAQEQQVALESTNDEIGILEDVLSEALEWCYDLDYQYRTKAITVRKYGELGVNASMEQVPVSIVRQFYTMRWYGFESFKAAQAIQAMISWGNVLTKMPPQILNGRRVDIGPMLEHITEAMCGPILASRTLIDQRKELGISPAMENEMMDSGFPIQTHPMDNDPQHLESHMADFKQAPNDLKKGHILEHIKQMKEKAAQQQMMAQQKAIGGPRPGAQVQAPPGGQNPPGAISRDKMPLAMPRKA